jgi:hypothetical protein
MCAVCKQGVPREDMVYQKGKVFHSQCFTDHGSSFPTPNHELASLSAKTRIELVQMKNLKVRAEQGGVLKPVKKPAKKKNSTKAKKKRVRKNRIKKRLRKIKKLRIRKKNSRKASTKKAKPRKIRKLKTKSKKRR